MRCWIDNGNDDRLDRAVLNGALTSADADAIREFREYLREAHRHGDREGQS